MKESSHASNTIRANRGATAALSLAVALLLVSCATTIPLDPVAPGIDRAAASLSRSLGAGIDPLLADEGSHGFATYLRARFGAHGLERAVSLADSGVPFWKIAEAVSGEHPTVFAMKMLRALDGGNPRGEPLERLVDAGWIRFRVRYFAGSPAERDIDFVERQLKKSAAAIESLVLVDEATCMRATANVALLKDQAVSVILYPSHTSLVRAFGDFNGTAFSSLFFSKDGDYLKPEASIALPFPNAIGSVPFAHELAHVYLALSETDPELLRPRPASILSDLAKRDAEFKDTFAALEKSLGNQLGEGYAEYAAERTDGGLHEAVFGDPDELTALYARGKRVTYTEMASLSRARNPADKGFGYAGLHSLYRFIDREFGPQKTHAFLTSEKTDGDALSILGIGWKELEARWNERIRGK